MKSKFLVPGLLVLALLIIIGWVYAQPSGGDPVVEGFKYREIAETLGITEEAVRKRVARGSQEFRRLFSLGGGAR